MCGPIALALPAGRGTGASFVGGRLLYNGGRLLTYTGLGALAGIFGKSLQLAGWQQGLSLVSGALILLLVVLPATVSGRFRRVSGLERLLQQVQRTMARLFARQGSWTLGAIGLLNGLLPCGFVYLALAGALSMPTVAQAMAYMLLFGLGTFPLMFLLSLSGKLVRPRLRYFFNRAVPYAATCLALLFILRGLNLGIPYLSPAVAPSTTTGTTLHACCSQVVKQ
jgi:sulfite exporter TauE/SafE